MAFVNTDILLYFLPLGSRRIASYLFKVNKNIHKENKFDYEIVLLLKENVILMLFS